MMPGGGVVFGVLAGDDRVSRSRSSARATPGPDAHVGQRSLPPRFHSRAGEACAEGGPVTRVLAIGVQSGLLSVSTVLRFVCI